jgi:hypothetical protein
MTLIGAEILHGLGDAIITGRTRGKEGFEDTLRPASSLGGADFISALSPVNPNFLGRA